MAFRLPHPLPHILPLLLIKIRSLAGPPRSRAGQLTHLQPHRHYLCLPGVRSCPQMIGAAIRRELRPALIRSHTTNPHTRHFPPHRRTTQDTARKTGLVDTIQHQAFTRTRYRQHRRYHHMPHLKEPIQFPPGPSPTPPPNLTAMNTSHHTVDLLTIRISCSTTS